MNSSTLLTDSSPTDDREKKVNDLTKKDGR